MAAYCVPAAEVLVGFTYLFATLVLVMREFAKKRGSVPKVQRGRGWVAESDAQMRMVSMFEIS